MEAAWENSVELPLSDPPEHVATIRIAAELATRKTLYQVMAMVANTAVPTTVQFVFTGQTLPPPLLVTIGEAARALSITQTHLKKMITAGWLTPIYHAEHDQPRVPWRKGLAEKSWPGWDYRIEWADLVGLMEKIKKNQHIPTDEPRPRIHRYKRIERTFTDDEGTKKLPATYSMDITARTQQMLRDETRDENGEPAWVTVNEVQDAMNAWLRDGRFVPYNTVRNALWIAYKNGWVEKETLTRDGMTDAERERYGKRGPAVRWRWIPEERRREQSMEKPEGGGE